MKRYREGGITNVCAGVWLFIFWGPFSCPLKRALGKELHHKLGMYTRVGYWPHIENPRSFNEKVMHRKLYSDRDLFYIVTDKEKVRNYIRETIGGDVLNRVLYITDNPEDIPFKLLPDEFVIKATHGSGMTKVINNKDEDNQEIRELCSDWLGKNIGERNEEYWYSDIQPQIICEKKLKGKRQEIPIDFKFFVFNGDVKYIQVDYDRFGDHTRRFYDRQWTAKGFKLTYPLGPIIEEPENLEKMLHVSEKIGDDFDFVRVDLYDTANSGVIFGEITLAPGSGAERFEPIKYDFELGSYWDME